MYDMYTWVFIVHTFVAVFVAWGIGANDVANSFASSVGARAITLRQAIFISAICEFLGAILLGAGVASTIKSNIARLSAFEQTPDVLMFGMLIVSVTTGIWLALATFLELPVSTSHSTVGSVVGMALVLRGGGAVVWSQHKDIFPYVNGMVPVFLSWIISPLLAGIAAVILYFITRTFVLRRKNSFDKAFLLLPAAIWITFFVIVVFIILTGSDNAQWDDVPDGTAIWISACCATGVTLAAAIFLFPIMRARIYQQEEYSKAVALEAGKAATMKDGEVSKVGGEHDDAAGEPVAIRVDSASNGVAPRPHGNETVVEGERMTSYKSGVVSAHAPYAWADRILPTTEVPLPTTENVAPGMASHDGVVQPMASPGDELRASQQHAAYNLEPEGADNPANPPSDNARKATGFRAAYDRWGSTLVGGLRAVKSPFSNAVHSKGMNNFKNSKWAQACVNNRVFRWLTHGANYDVHAIVNTNKHVGRVHQTAEKFDYNTERAFRYLQVFTACTMSFAHGSNDVANSIGPYAASYTIWQTESIGKNSPVSTWMLAVGGVGIVLGIATYGYKIIRVLGVKAVHLTNSRGYCVELAAAITVVVASRYGLPVSTTQVLTGAVLAVGLFEGIKGVNWREFLKIFIGWVLTLAVAGLLSAALSAIFLYSPNKPSSDAMLDTFYQLTNQTNTMLTELAGNPSANQGYVQGLTQQLTDLRKLVVPNDLPEASNLNSETFNYFNQVYT